jgi:hypothetical protein
MVVPAVCIGNPDGDSFVRLTNLNTTIAERNFMVELDLSCVTSLHGGNHT